MPEMNTAVQAWLADHANRGCRARSMVDAMLQVGFERPIADVAVQRALLAATGRYSEANYPHGVEAPIGAYRYDPAPVAAGNVIRAHDRDIKVLMRCERPQVIVFGDVLSADECAELIERARPELKRSFTMDPENGGPKIIADRTSESMFIKRGGDPFISGLEQRIASLMNWPVENGEDLQVVNYQAGAEYRAHYDYFRPHEPGTVAHTAHGGNRVATLLIYLNNVPSGGETYFPHPGISVAAKQGNAVYFRYMSGRREFDLLTLHGGAPVLDGEKWIMTKWGRERAYNPHSHEKSK